MFLCFCISIIGICLQGFTILLLSISKPNELPKLPNGKNDFSQCRKLEDYPPEYHYAECCWNENTIEHSHGLDSHYYSEEEQNSKEIADWRNDVVAHRKFAPYCYYHKPGFSIHQTSSDANAPGQEVHPTMWPTVDAFGERCLITLLRYGG